MILFKKGVAEILQENLNNKTRMLSQCKNNDKTHAAIFNNNYWEGNQVTVIANELGVKIETDEFWRVAMRFQEKHFKLVEK